ncbi:zinc-dependent alcohol dehydrogenase family protein [Caulobacter sp. NIBR1757]|uniref:zinc-dependent alcohol dehydrogenase family protein n=1 Tax=Caulobacter sp. NIBR1757 TaxID=3016000 RepID=UPI0022F0E9D2|nr:zinc-dependent alcohol dehydrogenase family protein [Caulobacter sp. NIBR1757]WGM39344.1 putative alcohol dehydrogenase AdhA [Caulobacter sp. NIBR1757]
MLAMALEAAHRRLTAVSLPDPVAGPGEVILRVHACGVCRTDLHVVDGDLGHGLAGVIPGHEIVGTVQSLGVGVTNLRVGDRVGVPWLGGACGRCRYCREGAENLCDAPEFTGWTRHGGYAEQVSARADFCIPLPPGLSDIEAAPLLCAGLIGFRAWRMACEQRPVRRLGLYGFGAAAHLLAQLAIAEGQAVHAFTRSGDAAAQRLARDLGCVWAGGSDEEPEDPLDAAIIFAPVGELVPIALRAVRKGGTVVCAGIHMSDIPGFPYASLWNERRLVSVANLTRADAREYLPRALSAGVRAQVTAYDLTRANEALDDLRAGAFAGAAVLVTGAGRDPDPARDDT